MTLIAPLHFQGTEQSSRKFADVFKKKHSELRKNAYWGLGITNTNLSGNETLSEILEHAKKENNRSREACVKLGWMNKDGSLHNDAPQIVRENYYIDKPDLSTRYSWIYRSVAELC